MKVDHEKFILENCNIRLLEPLGPVKRHHQMECLSCSHVWSATPLSRVQSFKKWGRGGCPECTKKRHRAERREVHLEYEKELRKRGLVILSEYTQLRGTHHLMFKNVNCGHEFSARPANVIDTGIVCSVCGVKDRIANLQAHNEILLEEWRKTATEWQLYRSKVHSLTAQTYREHKTIINPLNLPRGLAGTEGAYHLDHIQSVRWCFENGISEEQCASVENLQMLDWRTNVSKGKTPFEEWLEANDITEDELFEAIISEGN